MSSPNQGLLRQTAEFWERIAQREMTLEQARQAVENLHNLFRLLAAWDSAERSRTSASAIADAREAA
jgi:hypothetical protein